MTKLKLIAAYLVMLPLSMRSAFLTAYRETRRTGKLTYKLSEQKFFKSKHQAIIEANDKAEKTGMRWYVIKVDYGKYVAVFERYLEYNPLKTVYQTV